MLAGPEKRHSKETERISAKNQREPIIGTKAQQFEDIADVPQEITQKEILRGLDSSLFHTDSVPIAPQDIRAGPMTQLNDEKLSKRTSAQQDTLPCDRKTGSFHT